MSSHSPSSSSLGGGGGAFSFTRSFRSRGHVAWSFSQGAMHSRSKMWFLLQGRRTTSGYSSVDIRQLSVLCGGGKVLPSRKGLPHIGQSISGFNDFFGTLSSSKPPTHQP